MRATPLRQLLVFERIKPASEDERRFMKERLTRRHQRFEDVGSLLGMYLHVFGAVVEPFVALRQSLPLLLLAHGLFIALILVWRRIPRHRHRLRTLTALVLQVGSIVPYAYLNHNVLLTAEPFTIRTHLGVIAMLGILMSCLNLQSFRWLFPLQLAAYGGILTLTWSPLHLRPAMVGVAVVCGLFCWILCDALGRLEQRSAHREYEIERAKRHAEAERSARDLELARHVQRSNLPPERIVSATSSARLAMEACAAVGGDWLAYRRLGDGTEVFLVADAVGKGVPASLISHAVQSLWAESLTDEAFEPEAWLLRVNTTLCQMDPRRKHGATIGILLLAGRSVTYWSAGHVPVYVVRTEGDKTSARALSARGDMLGVSDRIELIPKALELPAGCDCRLLLGSDGVFDLGFMHKSRDIVHLSEAFDAHGAVALQVLPVEDDKTLIQIKVAA